ncbi:RNA 2'-phosphotransferase [Phaeobacter gallaeciensis]|uniref:RNA 2'-phosphotransferase n=1 Tax=Phaeobacter gallaeciensis TaxID=60890 RepID=UPI00237F3EF0|nr:RNA 2'-phosphotransferase [Phaeobacter gallaeciensis]MDE4099728.1 RNA 2'-phosphotransferase [Phaeobacter gallaeciensis]MDE4108537.1 RNA 2'-phosphotransferase [Phaeobacter gallaeciensis]MDE4110447.1 RNA 2'-phosphotransferase [Phaeobacter gallaeciensis]MDE4117369.1 RNA 2'-phosphotransferase [Phaeobacter gallaeciensis]MDE4121843.1 RNA 2'-phosphotransferase [Phaeobacter gallaeciensis]
MTRQSKLLSRILRHEPDLVGLTLGRGGWIQVDDLLRALKKAGHRITRDALHQIVAENDKQRFTLSGDGRRIRAAQGHSIPVELELSPSESPTVLFHGTASANLDAIFASGLIPGRRQHVHLSPDQDTALKVGTRHGRPVVLRVNTAAMHADGLIFWRADNGVWLTSSVPSKYLGF